MNNPPLPITHYPLPYLRLSQTLPAMKGLAILMIVVFHLWGYSKNSFLISPILQEIGQGGLKNWVDGSLNLFCALGEYGVHIFIFASGFGLASSWWLKSQKESSNSFNIKNFWQRRLFRLFPLYWLAHILAFGVFLWQPAWVPYGQEIFHSGNFQILFATFASLTTLRNFIFQYYFFLNGAWWYIGLAVQFYLIFPILVHIGQRWGWTRLLLSALLISGLYRTLIIALPLDEITTDILLRGALFPSRLFGFTFGMVLSLYLLKIESLNQNKLLNHFSSLLFKKKWLWVSILLLMIGVGCDWISAEKWMVFRIPADMLIGVSELGLLFNILESANFLQAGLSVIGKYSYGIYLTHMNVMIGLWMSLTPILTSYWLRLFFVLMVTSFLGIYFELGYRWLMRRFSVKAN